MASRANHTTPEDGRRAPIGAARLRARGGQRAVGVIQTSLAAEGPLTRAQLRDRVGAAGLRTEGQALVALLFHACNRGIAVRGPMVGREHAYVLVRDWLDPPSRIDRERALAELARRYLAGHTCAEERDLAKWAGLPLRDARAGLAAIASELTEREGLIALKRIPRAAELPPPRLLGSFDPVLHGWRSREFVLGDDEPEIVTGGIFRPIALAHGRAVAAWGIRGSKVWIKAFAELPQATSDALESDAAAAVRYLGL